jgi:glycosyltransferase involved in cell wall biosynthesis
MKILIATNHLDDKAGSELFTFSLAVGLKEKGHQISVFSPFCGEIAAKISNLGIETTDNLLFWRNKKFDIIHAQHNIPTIMVRSIFPETPMVFMSHGVLPELEQSPSIEIGINRYAAVSEEVAGNLIDRGGVSESKIEIVRNFIDTEKFKPIKKAKNKPEKILVLSNHYIEETKRIIEQTAKNLKLSLEHVGLPENSVENVEDFINNSDIVITLGRGALEAMACEKNVIVYDKHGADGLVNENNFFEIRKNNFSGRRFGKKYSVADLEKEIGKYSGNLGRELRKIVEKENSNNVILGKLERIYSECAQEKVFGSQIKSLQLYDELFFLEKLSVQLKSALKEKKREINQREKEAEVTKKNKVWKLVKRYVRLKKYFF